MDFHQQLAHTKKYAEAFWQKEMIDRPYVCVTAPIKPVVFSWSPAKSFDVCMREAYDEILIPYQNLIDHTFFGGEALPNLELTLGPDQYAAFLGGTIEASSENVTTWVHPFIDDWSDFHAQIDRSPDGYFEKLKRFFEYAAKQASGRFLLNMLDLHSNMDALSAMRGAQNLCFDLIDSDEEIHRVLKEVNDTYESVFQMAYEAGGMKEAGTIGWSPIYCSQKSAVLQCDFSCLIGPEHANEFVFPAIEYEASLLDHNIYHLDGKDALRHLDTILSLDCIDCIQWVPGAGQPRTLEWMDLLKKIQSAGKSLWIYDWTAEENKAYHKELNPALVAFSLQTDTPDQAQSLLETLKKTV